MSSNGDRVSIGDVIKELKQEFPDITVSKIRFLESEGLIDPDRTVSGYRKFSSSDVARLKYILRLQRDQFLPLKVIRKRLDHSEGPVSDDEGQQQLISDSDDEAEAPVIGSGMSLTEAELASASGLTSDELGELAEFGLLRPASAGGSAAFDEDDLMIARTAKGFAKFGIQPRHLKMYVNFAEREAGLFQQVAPTKARSASSRNQAATSVNELAKLSRRMKQVLLRNALNQ